MPGPCTGNALMAGTGWIRSGFSKYPQGQGPQLHQGV
jgi:hypothetical protein